MTAPTVVNLRNSAYDVYIGRAGRGQDGYLGNPVAVGRVCPICNQVHTAAGDTLRCYEQYARKRIADDPEFRERVKSLKGRLGCFCKPGPCHGDILVRLWHELN